VLAGIVVVFGSIIAGYLLEKGNLLVLLQPAELVTIGGAAIGTALIANPPMVMKRILKGIVSAIKGSPYNQAVFLETLKMLYEFFSHVSKVGMQTIEAEVDDPGKSPVLSKYPKFLGDAGFLNFLCDTIRTYSAGSMSHHQLDHLMEIDLESVTQEDETPITALNTLSDSLPGLGIVAAVLGVVVTMGSLGGPPEEIGEKVAAALVGTFLGILLCYGVVGPLAANMTKSADEHNEYLHVLRVLLLAFLKGAAPMIAIEMGRRAIPAHVRPNFNEMEKNCKGGGVEAAAA
jgi:chemotaxis protein MotA